MSFFYLWNEELNEARWMTSWDTEPHDIDQFVKKIVLALNEIKL